VTDDSKRNLQEYLLWVVALQRSMEAALVGDPSNIWKHGGYKQFAHKYNQLLAEIGRNIPLPPILDMYNLDVIPGIGDTVAVQQKEIFESVHANVSILRAFLEGKAGTVENETVALRDFFQAKLRSAVFRPPDLEREVQDAIEQLLIGRGLQKGQDYDREVGRAKISSKEVIPDFIMLRLSLAIEVKLTKSAARVKEVIDEINADIAGYSKRYGSILFIVYDLGHIRDEVEFRRDLESQGNVAILVVKQ
jgi:REase_DpnII-MboI